MHRRFTIIAIIALALGAFAQEPAHAPAVQPAASALWDTLARGNRDFVAGKIAYPNIASQREQLRDHQTPPVTILGCSDSRVPPELVFNQQLGSLFVVRTAGNVADEFGVASIEFAIANGYTKLIVVLAHEECGAVKAAVRRDEPGTPALRDLVRRIRMSFAGLKWDETAPGLMQHAAELNARGAAAALLADSALIRDAVLSGKVQVVSAYYDFDTGEVRRLE
jgi:carbonic anhydrase